MSVEGATMEPLSAESVIAQRLQKEADWCEANKTLRDSNVDARLALEALDAAGYVLVSRDNSGQ